VGIQRGFVVNQLAQFRLKRLFPVLGGGEGGVAHLEPARGIGG